MGTDPGCIFCMIAQGNADAHVVYQDDLVTAFMDIHPINTGHVLVIPNRHTQGLSGLDPVYGERMFTVAQSLAAALRRSELDPDGVNLLLADGAAAGQTVFHLHLHVLPRYEGDGFSFRHGGEVDPEKLSPGQAAEMIRSVIP